MSALSPIKVDADTDRRIADAAHYLGRTKKDIVDAAVRDYVDAHRDEMNKAIQASHSRLDGSQAAVVSEITGLSGDRLVELGGVPEQLRRRGAASPNGTRSCPTDEVNF